MSALPTLWILGDQLDAEHPGLSDRRTRILMIESDALIGSHRWHRQRLHFVLSSMRHFTESLRARGLLLSLGKLTDRAGVHARAREVLRGLRRGEI